MNHIQTEKAMACAAQAADYNPTVGENLDNRIARMEIELAQLYAAKESLAPLLHMRIQDLRIAMQY